MPGPQVKAALSERWEAAQEALQAALEQFRESRLYVQTVCAALLVGVAGLVHLLPYGPLARVDQSLRWVVSQDYDFAATWRKADGWARGHGGWVSAGSGLWKQGLARLQDWVGYTDTAGGAGLPWAAAPAASQGQAAPEVRQSDPLAMLMPVDGAVHWGYGWVPPEFGEHFHMGLDLLTKAGTPVSAMADGTVVAVRTDPELGGLVEIRHGQMVVVYAQLEAITVNAGDAIGRGEVFAAVAPARGIEGSQPPHLHVEIRPVETGTPVNPAPHLGLGGEQL